LFTQEGAMDTCSFDFEDIMAFLFDDDWDAE
jgi:hypothetical protein